MMTVNSENFQSNRWGISFFPLLTISYPWLPPNIDFEWKFLPYEYGKVFFCERMMIFIIHQYKMKRQEVDKQNSIPISSSVLKKKFYLFLALHYKLQNWMKKKPNKTRIFFRPKWKRTILQQFNIFHAELCYG